MYLVKKKSRELRKSIRLIFSTHEPGIFKRLNTYDPDFDKNFLNFPSARKQRDLSRKEDISHGI